MTTRADVIKSGRKYLGVSYTLGTPSPCSSRQMDCDCFTKLPSQTNRFANTSACQPAG